MKENVKNNLDSLIGVLTIVSTVALFVNGLLHSGKKHGRSDTAISLSFFPWGIYRGVEYFWHDDYANVDWDKKVANDINSCTDIIIKIDSENADKSKINETLEKLSNKFEEYPKEKKNYIKEVVRIYINYIKYWRCDFLNSVTDFMDSGLYKHIKSNNTIEYGNKLSGFGLQDDVELFEQATEELKKYVERAMLSMDYYKIEEVVSTVKLSQKKSDQEFHRIFKLLFNEEL
jgi:hypothetical protein